MERTFDGLQQDFMDYNWSAFSMHVNESGLVDEEFEAIDETYHIEYCEWVVEFLESNLGSIYDKDDQYVLDGIEYFERLKLWWITQGTRMIKGLDYITG